MHANLYELSEQITTDPQVTPEEVARLNQELLHRLETEPLPQTTRRAAIPLGEAREILQRMIEHPVVGTKATEVYDPTGRYGFCFGRAQWAAIELLRRGIAKNSIKKIFAVGPMLDDGINWQFHVAAMVRTEKGRWLVIDSVYEKLMTLTEWMETLNKSSVDKKLLFYATEPSRLGASTTMKFTARHFRSPYNDPEYNLYFEDMMKDFRELSRQTMKQRRSCGKAFLN